MSSGSVCPEARLCRNETVALFHSDPGSAKLSTRQLRQERPGYPEIYQEEYEESPEETEMYLKGKRKLAPTLIISKSALDKNKLMPRERRTHAKYIIFAGQTIKEIWNK